MSWKDKALDKLEAEQKTARYDKYAQIMKNAVREALVDFCDQDEEFAQAVAQGGTFEDCMKAVAQNCGGGISDLEAFRRAVRFYFPGAEVRFQMSVDLTGSVRPAAGEASADPGAGAVEPVPKILDLSDFW